VAQQDITIEILRDIRSELREIKGQQSAFQEQQSAFQEQQSAFQEQQQAFQRQSLARFEVIETALRDMAEQLIILARA
jgi:hypothetical protein